MSEVLIKFRCTHYTSRGCPLEVCSPWESGCGSRFTDIDVRLKGERGVFRQTWQLPLKPALVKSEQAGALDQQIGELQFSLRSYFLCKVESCQGRHSACRGY